MNYLFSSYANDIMQLHFKLQIGGTTSTTGSARQTVCCIVDNSVNNCAAIMDAVMIAKE